MDRTELLRRVNGRSEKRFGPRISDSMLDDLVEERVIRGPERQPSGEPRPNYQRDDETLRTLVRVRWLKARGLRRNSQIRIYLWLAYFDVPFDLFLQDLRSEYSRVAGQLLRRVSSTFDPSRGAAAERDIGTLNRQMGRVDPRLLPGEQSLDPVGLVDAYGLMRFGLSGNFFEGVVQDLFEKLGLSTAIDQVGPDSLSFIQETYKNLLADPEESDAAVRNLIPEFHEVHCQHAREILDQLPWLMTKGIQIVSDLGLNWIPGAKTLDPHLKLAAKALFQPAFRVGTFVQWAIAIRQGHTEGMFDRTFLTMIRNIRDLSSGMRRIQIS